LGRSPISCTLAALLPDCFAPSRLERMMGASPTRRVPMRSRQLPLDLGKTSTSPPLLWDVLPAENQLAAMTTLARLIAQAAVSAVHEEECLDATTDDEPVA
jgi:hypothetical protein